jgi:phage terminase large subunit-like protein
MHVSPNPKYFFDAKAADRPLKFMEKYLRFYEGIYAGRAFEALPWQKKLTRDLFGWKHKEGGLRRFRQLFMEIAKGAGKSPWLAAIGLYMLLADNEPAAEIYSIATDEFQAGVTFNNGKKFVEKSPELSRLCVVKEFTITVPSTDSKWEILAGTAEGKHGLRPTCILADEAHEWPNSKLYDNMFANLTKRSQPLGLVATNAGDSKQSICWQLHEQAKRVESGESKIESLYSCIYAAGKDDDIAAESTWKKAQPSLGDTISLDAYRDLYTAAKENPRLMPRFCRFYLSLWIEGADKWLNMDHWDKCTGELPPAAELRKLPCYLALDLSLNDDASSLAQIWTDDDKLYLRVRHWIPEATAKRYELQYQTPWSEWARGGFVKLLNTETVDDAAQGRIAKLIAKLQARHQVKSLAYDRWKASKVVARVERGGLPCIPVRQDFSGLSKACHELERSLKARSIVIEPNPLLRWQACNVEVVADNNGCIRPVKEAAKGQYKGVRSKKIDGIVATVTGLSQIVRDSLGEGEETDKFNKPFSGDILCL